MAYLRNAWYVAAWTSELESGKLLARRYLDEPVVIFRDAGGVKALRVLERLIAEEAAARPA
jgi:vanillate O-demethylase monooxygenase subunit